MRSTIRLTALAVVAPCCLVLAGCSAEVNVGGGSDASGEEIADEVRGDYTEKTGIELTRLTCEGVEANVGEKFTCSGRNARGVQLEIAGRVTDAGSDGFDYSWHVTGAVAPGVLYERALRRQLEAEGVVLAEARCPVEIEVEVGEEVRCRATDRGGSSRGVTLRLSDLDGGFEYRVADGSSGEGPSA
jgi:Domain of unknown function (DUF4333)